MEPVSTMSLRVSDVISTAAEMAVLRDGKSGILTFLV
jgi:hypothetical protein